MSDPVGPWGVIAYVASIANYRDSIPRLRDTRHDIWISDWWSMLLEYGHRSDPRIVKHGIHMTDGVFWFRGYRLLSGWLLQREST